MRLTLVAGVLVGLGVAARFAPAETNGKQFKDVRVTARSVPEQAKRFRLGADARQMEHGGTDFTRMITMRGQEFLAQSFEIDHDFYRAAFVVGGSDELDLVARIEPPLPGELAAASPWVTVERQNAALLEKQTLAVAFRKIKELGRPEELRLVRVQREYQLIGLNPFVRVRANGTDEVESLTVQLGHATGTFTGFSLMLGKILGFRATPTHLYVYTTANVGYEVAISVVDGALHFSSSRQLGEVSELIKAQAQKIPAAIKRVEVCEGELAEGGA